MIIFKTALYMLFSAYIYIYIYIYILSVPKIETHNFYDFVGGVLFTIHFKYILGVQ